MAIGSLKTSGRLLPETITGPHELQERSVEELTAFAREVRRFLLKSVSQTGGHIGANLGTVDLTIALHRAFRSPEEPIVWDTGHQGYTHKIVTGRAKRFPSLNRYGGMSRFVSRAESGHDTIEASHAGTSISVALGLALARRLQRNRRPVVAVIGDGALAEGMALEAINHAAVENTKLVIVLNDNGYAISPGFGALHETLQSGPEAAGAFFHGLGLHYVGPVDGHDIGAMLAAFEEAKLAERVPLVHVKTIKGHGWRPADAHPYRQHFSFPFDPETGELTGGAAPQPTYPDVAARVVEEEMERDERIVCITPSTIYATGLAGVFERFPERCFDPGMEEQHALTLTVGLALGGMKPVIAYQSTFLQRAFDQLIHDVCFTNQPTLILATRSGFAGYDNPTHHGIYDFAYLRGLPNLSILYPKDGYETERMVRDELRHLVGPVLIAMPYGPVDSFDPSVLAEAETSFARPQIVERGDALTLITVGNKFGTARTVVDKLRLAGIDAGLVNLRYLKPLPLDALVEILRATPRAVTLEEAVLDGGVGSAIASLVADEGLGCDLLRLGLPTRFVQPGTNAELCALYSLDTPGILASIEERWPELEWKRS